MHPEGVRMGSIPEIEMTLLSVFSLDMIYIYIYIYIDARLGPIITNIYDTTSVGW